MIIRVSICTINQLRASLVPTRLEGMCTSIIEFHDSAKRTPWAVVGVSGGGTNNSRRNHL